MNVLSIFDQRISAIFEEGAPGQRKPFSFRRLAKRAVREMEDETFVIDGIDTAPALYTVLVSAANDALMRPMYVQICDEISQLVEAQAKKRGYTFVGRPLVRFMVDPALRNGRFSVFAENVDPRTLARLRDEENAYLGVTSPQGMPDLVPDLVPVEDEEPAPIASEVAFVEDDLGLDSIDEVPAEELPTPSADVLDEEPLDEPMASDDSIADNPIESAASVAGDGLDDEYEVEEYVPDETDEIEEPVKASEPVKRFAKRFGFFRSALHAKEEPIAETGEAVGAVAEAAGAAIGVASGAAEAAGATSGAFSEAATEDVVANDAEADELAVDEAYAPAEESDEAAHAAEDDSDVPEASESMGEPVAPSAFDAASESVADVPEIAAESASEALAASAADDVAKPEPQAFSSRVPMPMFTPDEAPAPMPAPMPMYDLDEVPTPAGVPMPSDNASHEIASAPSAATNTSNAELETALDLQAPPTRVIPMRRQRDTCTLTDVATGRTYQVIVRRTPIGRERVPGGIVLHDPNVSRRHAELIFEDGVWHIRDLNSTNGTLVDDMDVREAILTDGDVITIGLTNLEFRTE